MDWSGHGLVVALSRIRLKAHNKTTKISQQCASRPRFEPRALPITYQKHYHLCQLVRFVLFNMLHVITTWRTQTSEVGATVAPVPKSINCINHSSIATLVIKVTGVSCFYQNYLENLGVFRIPRRKVSTNSAYSGILALLYNDWLCILSSWFRAS